MAQAYGAMPPLASKVSRYPVPTIPPGNAAIKISGAMGADCVTVNV